MSDEYWLTTSSFTKVRYRANRMRRLIDRLLQPSQLFLSDASLGAKGIASARLLKSLPSMFDHSGLVETQLEATSADGTKVTSKRPQGNLSSCRIVS